MIWIITYNGNKRKMISWLLNDPWKAYKKIDLNWACCIDKTLIKQV